MHAIKISLILALFATGASILTAAVSMPPIFSDNLVLQREKPVKFWGKSTANSKIEVRFGEIKESATADANGEWKLSLPPMKTVKTGTDLFVYENEKLAKKFANVVVGEVWFIGGQSNMEYTPKGYGKANFDAENILARANRPDIRICNGNWAPLTPERMKSFSVLGFYFAEYLSKDLDVPVGLIKKAMGGAAMVAFLPKESLEKIPYLKKYNADWEKSMEGYDYEKALAKHKARLEKRKADIAAKRPAENIHWKDTPQKHSTCAAQYTPSSLYKSLKQLLGFTIRGALWYQGESDATSPSVDCFAEQLCEIIGVLRTAAGEPDLPFYQVLLTSYQTRDNWIEARKQQVKAAKSSPCSIINILDLGDKHDIHPQRKQEVAKRLELSVLRDIFKHSEIPQSFVEFDNAKFDTNTVVVKAEKCTSKIFAYPEIKGVEILDKNGNWIAPQNVSLSNNALRVEAPKGTDIFGVRYLNKNWAQDDVCLWVTKDFPVFPFEFLK